MINVSPAVLRHKTILGSDVPFSFFHSLHQVSACGKQVAHTVVRLPSGRAPLGKSKAPAWSEQKLSSHRMQSWFPAVPAGQVFPWDFLQRFRCQSVQSIWTPRNRNTLMFCCPQSPLQPKNVMKILKIQVLEEQCLEELVKMILWSLTLLAEHGHSNPSGTAVWNYTTHHTEIYFWDFQEFTKNYFFGKCTGIKRIKDYIGEYYW